MLTVKNFKFQLIIFFSMERAFCGTFLYNFEFSRSNTPVLPPLDTPPPSQKKLLSVPDMKYFQYCFSYVIFTCTKYVPVSFYLLFFCFSEVLKKSTKNPLKFDLWIFRRKKNYFPLPWTCFSWNFTQLKLLHLWTILTH